MDCGGPHCAPCRLPLLLTLEMRAAGKADADDVFFQAPPSSPSFPVFSQSANRRPPTAAHFTTMFHARSMLRPP